VPARNRLPQFLLRKLHWTAVQLSLHWSAGKQTCSILMLKLSKTTTTEVLTTTTTTTQMTPIEPVKIFPDFIFYFYFRATCLFSSFRCWSTEVICSAATELLKFLRRLTRRKTIMRIIRHTLSWKENSTSLEDIMAATRYCFVWQIKIMKSLKTQLSNLKIIFKIARLDGCSLNELPAQLNEDRKYGHAALSTENGQKGKIKYWF